jgi:hypothetical protein
MPEYMGWANIIDTHKFYFTAASDEDAQELIDMVNNCELNLDDLHKGNYSIKGIEVICDSPERIGE